MLIQWFPGHMHRARKQITEALKNTDVVIEMLDARMIVSSCNPLLQEIRGNHKRVLLLNKVDLADPKVTSLWEEWFKKNKIPCFQLTALDKKRTKQIPGMCQRLIKRKISFFNPLQMLVVGIPNVGKSTLINTLVGRTVAKAENKAAVTRKVRLIAIDKETTLADTPGVLWPKIDDPETSIKLAAYGSVRDVVMEYREVAWFIGDYLLKYYPDLIQERYNLTSLPRVGSELVEAIGAARNCLIAGGEIDIQRSSEVLIKELRSNAIGKISLDRPQDFSDQKKLLRLFSSGSPVK